MQYNLRSEPDREAEKITSVLGLAKRSADVLQKLQPRLVLRRQVELDIQPGQSTLPGDFPQPRQHTMLDSAAEYAATQQKCVHRQRAPLRSEDHQPSDAVVAETIADGNGQSFEPGEVLQVRLR